MPLIIPLAVTESAGFDRTGWPFTRGVPLPEGALREPGALRMLGPDSQPVPAQCRALSRWPDGSLKWVLTDFQADVPARGKTVYRLTHHHKNDAPEPTHPVRIDEDEERIAVDTGMLQFRVSKQAFSFIESASPFIESPHAGDAWVKISEGLSDGGTQRRLYGMGGVCRASLARDVYTATVEEAGPLRAVIRCEGAFEADIPMHHYTGYRPFRFITRLYAYAGHAMLRVLHTVVVTCNPRETEIEEIAVRIPVALHGPVRCRLSANRPLNHTLTPGEALHLAQREDNHFYLYRQTPVARRCIAEGERAEGWMVLEDDRAGMGVALRYMAEEYPKALETDGRGVTVHLWRDPDGKRLKLSRYAEEVAWHEGEGVYADGTGVAKTSEFFLCFYPYRQKRNRKRRKQEDPPADPVIDRLRGMLSPPHAAFEPAWAARCGVTGGFAPYNPGRFPASERMMTGFVDWMERCIRLGRWYGFLDWGDVLAAWDADVDDWRFRGRWGWCNSEWDPRHGVWVQYLRTGEPGYFRLGEAMTRHSVDVDTCHYHPFRPYMVGGCFRHSVDHFGDEPCASHTFLDNWVDYYYLTGDLRTYEVLQEAGAFFMRYRWTQDPAYSFSLRSIANTLRGLLFVYEVTGDRRYRNRAEEVYAVVAQGQNDDGSWHKRFQISTPDRLPDQMPYGMATEGTTLAVEMGGAAPFTDDEYRALGGAFARMIRVLPYEEQKGYQTHYLMIGLELFHRMTGRADAAEVYRRAVDWFCGYPNRFDAAFALREHYGGVLCRHTAYAYRLTGERRYLKIGRTILQKLIETQDWSDDPKRRGAIGMSPTHLSLLFFGVPCLLGALADAGMDETAEQGS